MAASRNFGIRKRESIGLIKSMVEAACPRQVSCADILVLASREAVAVAGGPVIRVPMGRRDSTAVPSGKLAQALLPPSDIGVDGMLFLFADKGMTVEESVAIMGAHTLGVTHCFNIQNRLRNRRRGFEMLLKLSCPLGSFTPNTSFVLNDPTTPLLFDTNYYFNAASGRGVLRIDSEMPFDPRTTRFVERFASDPAHFFQVFSSAFVKLSSYRVLTGDKGTVRNECSVIN